MRRLQPWYAARIAVLLGIVAAVAALQATQQPVALVLARLAQSAGPAGDQVSVPLLLTVPEGVEVGSLKLVVRSRGTVATFHNVMARGLAEGLGIEAKYEFKTEGDEGIVNLTLEAPEKDGVREALPSGPLADFVFRVSPDAKPEQVVPLSVQATATGTKRGSAPVAVDVKDSQIVVSQGYIPPCFFYMH